MRNSSRPLPPGGCRIPQVLVPLGGAGVLQRAPRGGARSGGCMSTLAASSKAQVKRKRAPSGSAAERRQGPVLSFLASSRGCSQYPRKTRKCSWGGAGVGRLPEHRLSPFSKARDPRGPGLGLRAVRASLLSSQCRGYTPRTRAFSADPGRRLGTHRPAHGGQDVCWARLQLTALLQPKDFCLLCLRFS